MGERSVRAGDRSYVPPTYREPIKMRENKMAMQEDLVAFLTGELELTSRHHGAKGRRLRLVTILVKQSCAPVIEIGRLVDWAASTVRMGLPGLGPEEIAKIVAGKLDQRAGQVADKVLEGARASRALDNDERPIAESKLTSDEWPI